MNFLKRTWAEIDLNNALHNLEKIKIAANGRKIMPIIKADAYGHGANILADLYVSQGIEIFAVSNINEAIKLRNHGIAADILILGYTPTEYTKVLSDNNISQAVYSLGYAKDLSNNANGNAVKCHLKIDTGMSRLGFNPSNLDEIEETLKLENLMFDGIFTHFSSADSIDAVDKEFTDGQFEKFDCLVKKLSHNGYTFKYNHCSNSAATMLRCVEGDLVRPGIILYGLTPSDGLGLKSNLKPIMSLKSVVSMVKTLESDRFVSYGRTYKTEKPTVIATLPIGYADGYPRAMSKNGYVLINGKKAPIVGRVCMDQMMVDVTEIENVTIGTEATVVGDGGLGFQDVAEICDTIDYEIVCNISVRVPRVYKKDGETVGVEYLGGNL